MVDAFQFTRGCGVVYIAHFTMASPMLEVPVCYALLSARKRKT